RHTRSKRDWSSDVCSSDLKEYLRLLEEAARRDHRKLGAELDLFSFPEEIGSGLAVFHPKGGIIRRELENYSRERHEAAGYSFVRSEERRVGKECGPWWCVF